VDATVDQSTNDKMQKAYDISSQMGHAPGRVYSYKLDYRQTPNEFHNNGGGQCDGFAADENISLINTHVSTPKNTYAVIEAFPGGFFHTFTMFRLSDHAGWNAMAYNRVIQTPTLSLTGATQAWFGSSELAIFGHYKDADSHLRYEFISNSPHRAQMNALSFGGISEAVTPDFGSVKISNEYNGPNLPSLDERKLMVDNLGIFCPLRRRHGGRPQGPPRPATCATACRSCSRSGAQPQNGAMYAGAKVVDNEQRKATAARPMPASS